MFSQRQNKQIDLVFSTRDKGLYYYQKALEGKSGPVVLIEGENFKLISSYDYLGLLGHPSIEAAAKEAIDNFGTGSGGVRLLSGTNTLHLSLEEQLADFVGRESVLTYTSGYSANIAVLSTLFSSKDVALIDSKIHQSTVDACKLAGLSFRRYEHNDVNSLERLLKLYRSGERVVIITEGIFSMDGDICRLPELLAVKEKYKALLMLDEAHSLGVLGEQGQGVIHHFGLNPRKVDIITASLSKAIPANGGFVAGSKELIALLQHNSSPFVFSAAMPPAAAAVVMKSINIMKTEPDRFLTLWNNTQYFRDQLITLGYDLGASESPILPLHVGRLEETLKFAGSLYEYGILATPVVYPAVAHDQGILRLCITAAHSRAYLDEVVEVFKKLG